jgi:hypothetical protein
MPTSFLKSGSHRCLARACSTVRVRSSPWACKSRHGRQRDCGIHGCNSRVLARGNWRHHTGFTDASARRRSHRGSDSGAADSAVSHIRYSGWQARAFHKPLTVLAMLLPKPLFPAGWRSSQLGFICRQAARFRLTGSWRRSAPALRQSSC